MRRLICGILCLLSVVLGEDEVGQNIEHYMKLARENYPLYQNTKLLDRVLSLTLERYNMHFIPHLRFSSKVSYQSDVTTLPFDNNQMQGIFPTFNYKPLSKDQYQFAFELAQPVLDMGLVAQKDMSCAQYATRKSDNVISLYKIQQSVINTFFSLLLLGEQIE
ncbi:MULTISPECIES: TolC family protein [Helicobacter]|uniref:Outer membrane efflux protein n=7 Tax=Helicobacter typhlonius TaxID=76936 RepID=A0A099UFG9_9HELI|nr:MULTISPECIES: TolC family protein [Helicobacter]TLD77807.1 hypothetical protein LS75_009255 [Helicobacter typhlonius]TLD88723.1 hypothetical protein LS67_003595 [Helicobacter sp. MIT 03-1616]CUU39621.1 Outer membrane efflux protein [Helicobacter typhlonius]HCD73182.1 hypothetical protein [Helicobacter sp.]